MKSKIKNCYYSQITRKVISLVLVFDLILVSCFCYGITAADTRAEVVGTGRSGTAVVVDDTWYTGATSEQGSTAENPYVLDTPGKLLSLALMLKNNGYGVAKSNMILSPETTSPAGSEVLPPATETGKPETPLIPTAPETPTVTPPPEIPVAPQPETPSTPQPETPTVPKQEAPASSDLGITGGSDGGKGITQNANRGDFHFRAEPTPLLLGDNNTAGGATEPPTQPPSEKPAEPPVVQPPETPTEKPTEKPAEPPTETTMDGLNPSTNGDSVETLKAVAPMAALQTDGTISSGFAGKFFRLSGTIDMSGFDNSESVSGAFTLWTPIGTVAIPFNGTFTGATASAINGFLYGNDRPQSPKAHNYYGFFGHLGAKAVVDNLHFTNVKFHVTDSRMNETTTATVSASAIGVVAAFNKGVIKNVKVEAPDYVDSTTSTVTYGGIELPDTTRMQTASCFGGMVGLNSGHILNATFIGNIHSQGELKTGTYSGGIGGITGETKEGGKLVNCTVKSHITFKNAGTVADINQAEPGVAHTIYIGGISGKYDDGTGTEQNPSISNCVFAGSIKAKGARSYNSVGGIVGYLFSGYVTQCVVSADIWYAGSSTSDYDGGVGGIAGSGLGGKLSVVDNSFAMGSVEAAFYAGGLAGKDVTVQNSYYTGAIKTVEAGAFDVTGGLVGKNKNSSVKDAYFAGTTLTPHTASIIGDLSVDGVKPGQLVSTAGAFYDKTLSPNRAVIDPNKAWEDKAGKTTEELCSEEFTGFTGKTVSEGAITSGAVWITSNTKYPRLAWTETVTAGALVSIPNVVGSGVTVSQSYVDLVQNISKISTAKWLDVQTGGASPNSYGNGYQMIEGKTGISTGITTSSLNLTGSDISSTYKHTTIAGVYNLLNSGYTNDTVGNLDKSQIEFTIEGVPFSGNTTRKTLYAPKKSTDTAIENATEFYKFLDYWQGGGAVLGSGFTIDANVSNLDLTTPIKPLPDYMQGIFAGTLDGKNKKLSNVTFEPKSRSLFGDGFYTTIKNLNFDKVSVGTSNGAIFLDDERFGLLLGRMDDSTISNIAVDGYDFYANGLSSNPIFGGIIGEDIAGGVISSVSVKNFNSKIGNYSQNNPEKDNVLKDFGVIAGKSMGKIENCTAQSIDVLLDIHSSTSSNDGVGGIAGFGMNIDNCRMTGKMKALGVDNNKAPNLGGIAGFTNNNGKISKSSVIASLEGMCVGGITGYTNWGGSVYDSYFTGNLNSTAYREFKNKDVIGGMIGHQSGGGTTVKNCFAFGNINAKDQGGGLIGIADNQSTIENSYANAVVTGNEGAGGFIGIKTEKVVGTSQDTFKNSFFIGQVNGLGAKGGLVGKAATAYKPPTLSNVMYDKQLVGRVKSLGSVASSADLGKLNGNITAGALGSSGFTDVAMHYPQIKAFASGTADAITKKVSDASTAKIFSLDSEAENEYLQGIKFTNITVGEVTQAGIKGYTAIVTPEALYYIEGTTKHAMMVRETNSNVYKHDQKNTYTEQGLLNVSYEFTNLPGFTALSIPYTVGIKAFDYGTGTEQEPYIIYDEYIFQDFAKFVSKGRDSQSLYYKIAGEPKTPNEGKPITLDMTTHAFEPIKGFSGHLLGNNSTISNVTLGVLQETENGKTTSYKGVFGKTNATAEVKDLTIKDIHVGSSVSEDFLYMGSFIAYAKGGTFTNILVDVKDPIVIPSNNKAYVGGFIGCIDGSGGLTSNLEHITAMTDIHSDGKKSQVAGGIVGGIKEGTVSIKNSASYGEIAGVNTAGGLIGKVENVGKTETDGVHIENASSLTNLSYTGWNGILGGLMGETVAPKQKEGDRGPGFVGLNLKLSNVYYGGEIATNKGKDGDGTLKGGLIGKAGIVVETGREGLASPLSDPIAAKDFAAVTPSADAQIQVFLAKTITNAAYAFDKTPYVSMNFDVYGHYTYFTDLRNGYNRYIDSIKENDTGKSSTWKLASTKGPDTAWQTNGNWKLEKGVFPILTHTGLTTTSEAIKSADKLTFHSIALFLTRAGKIGENKYQNAYITYNPTESAVKPAISTTPTATYVKFTTNQAMAVATGTEEAISLKLDWKGYSRTKNFTASTEPSGIPDFSWYAVNPNGMWSLQPETTITTEAAMDGSITSTTTAIHTKKGWSLYTADQLQGLSLLNDAAGKGETSGIKRNVLEKTVIPEETVNLALAKANLEVEDGNGVTLVQGDFIIPQDSYAESGETNKKTITGTLWRVMLGKDVNAKIYKDFRPIGNTEKPFSYQFDGLGNLISGLNFTAPTTGGISGGTIEPSGLFGTVSGGAIENTGLTAGGKVSLEGAKAPVGTVAGKLTNGSKIQNCFSTMGLFGDQINTNVGGIVGESDGSQGRNTIKNVFFTGAIQLSSGTAIAGGIVGKINDSDVTNSYVAGYVDGITFGAIGGTWGHGNNGYKNIYDKEATGSIPVIGSGSEKNLTVEPLTTEGMKNYKAWNNGWHYAAGYYPLQTCFTTESAAVAVVPIQYTPTARSASQGTVLYAPCTTGGISTELGVLGATTHGIYWNLQNGLKGSADQSIDSSGHLNFKMKNSGMVWPTLNLRGQSREVLFNLRCWYEDGKNIDGKMTYTISAPSELAELAAIVNGTVNVNNPNGGHKHKDKSDTSFTGEYHHSFENEVILLSDHLDLSEIPHWVSIGTEVHPFKGTFDGKENVIFKINQTLDAGETYGGLFGVVEGGAIKNIGMQSGSISATAGGVMPEKSVGGIAGKITNTKIENCFTSITVDGKIATYAGGLIGQALGTSSITQSFNMSQVAGGINAGGIAGKTGGTISNSYNTGMVKTENAQSSVAAGIVAAVDGGASISNCFTGGNMAAGTGGTNYGIAPAGRITNSWYDKQMTGTVSEIVGVTGKTTVNATKGDGIASGYYKPPFTPTVAQSKLFKNARGLSLLALDFAGGSYSGFQSGTAKRVLEDTTGVEMNLSTEIFRCTPMDESYVVTVEDASTGGSDTLVASVKSKIDSTEYILSKPYALYTKATIAVRYNFIFTPELIAKLSGSGVTSPPPTGTGTVTVINNEAELRNAVTSINQGSTKGVTYKLNADITMTGEKLPAMGTATHPFNGTFDGNGHSLRNVTISEQGSSGLFAYIGNTGKVKNLKLENLKVGGTVANGGNFYLGAIAAHNSGAIVNVAVFGIVEAFNANFEGITYMGSLVGENTGRVEGCYFVASNNGIGIAHRSKVTDFVGGLAGVNKGVFSGCYVSSDMKNIHIKGLFGSTKGGSFKNCYYNCGASSQNVENLRLVYAYDQVLKNSDLGKKVFVPYNDLKKAEFAQMLSSGLYGGTYYQGGKTYPELYCFTLMGMDLGDLQLMLSVRNLVDESKLDEADKGKVKDSFMNAICTYKDFGFPYFSNIGFNKELQVEMPILDRTLGCSVGAVIYGKNALYTDIGKIGGTDKQQVITIPTLEKSENAYKLVSAGQVDRVNTPKTIMLNITLNTLGSELPWGVFKKDSVGM